MYLDLPVSRGGADEADTRRSPPLSPLSSPLSRLPFLPGRSFHPDQVSSIWRASERAACKYGAPERALTCVFTCILLSEPHLGGPFFVGVEKKCLSVEFAKKKEKGRVVLDWLRLNCSPPHPTKKNSGRIEAPTREIGS